MRDQRNLLLALILLVLLISHKLSMVIAGICLLAYSVSRFRHHRTVSKEIPILFLSVLLFFVQWVILTRYGIRAADRILVGATHVTEVESFTTVGRIHAKRTISQHPVNQIWLFANLIGLGSISGLAWLGMADRQRSRGEYTFILGIGAVFVSLMVVTLLMGSVVTPVRFIFISEFVMAILAGAGTSYLLSRVVGHRKVLAFGIIVLALSSQVVVPGFLPDDPKTTRKYLTEQEQDGREFATYAHEPVQTDNWYSRTAHRGFVSHDVSLFTKQIPGNRTGLSAYRPGVEVHQSSLYGGDWTLLWDPLPVFESKCSKVYENQGVTYFRCI